MGWNYFLSMQSFRSLLPSLLPFFLSFSSSSTHILFVYLFMIKTTGLMDENATRQRKQNGQEVQKWDTTIDLEMPIYGSKSVTEN